MSELAYYFIVYGGGTAVMILNDLVYLHSSDSPNPKDIVTGGDGLGW